MPRRTLSPDKREHQTINPLHPFSQSEFVPCYLYTHEGHRHGGLVPLWSLKRTKHFQRVTIPIPGPELPFEMVSFLSAPSCRGSWGGWFLSSPVKQGGVPHSAGCWPAPHTPELLAQLLTQLWLMPVSLSSTKPRQSLGIAQGRDSSQQPARTRPSCL